MKNMPYGTVIYYGRSGGHGNMQFPSLFLLPFFILTLILSKNICIPLKNVLYK